MNASKSAVAVAKNFSGKAGFLAAVAASALVGCATKPVEAEPRLGKWSVFERTFSSARVYETNATSVRVVVRFASNGGREMVVPAAYRGGQNWQVRFVPNEAGRWTWKTECSDSANTGLHGISGSFYCTAPAQMERLNAPPLDNEAVRAPYFQALFNNPASDLGEAGNLMSPAARGQNTALFETLNAVEFWRLRSCPELVAQPANGADPARQIVALRTDSGDWFLAYTPGERSVSVALGAVPKNCQARWLNPRTGAAHSAIGVVTAARIEFPTPEPGDWFLELKSGK